MKKIILFILLIAFSYFNGRTQDVKEIKDINKNAILLNIF